MWRRQDEPKVSPSPQNVVVTPPPQAVAPPPKPQVIEPVVPKAASSLVCKGITIKGEVTGNEDIQVDGEVHGSLRLAGSRVLIGQDGRVTGDIEAREIVIRGTLKGNLLASERILVGHTGRWKGNSISPRLVIDEGGVVSGNLEVAQPRDQKSGRAPDRAKGTNGAAVSTSTSTGNAANVPAPAAPSVGSNGSSVSHQPVVAVSTKAPDTIV